MPKSTAHEILATTGLAATGAPAAVGSAAALTLETGGVLVSALTLMGQALWRYTPLIWRGATWVASKIPWELEIPFLDSTSSVDKYLQKRRLADVLPGRVNMNALQPLDRSNGLLKSVLKSKHFLPRDEMTTRRHHWDFKVIGDYSTHRGATTSINGPHHSIKVNSYQLARDTRLYERRAFEHDIGIAERFMRLKWPGVAAISQPRFNKTRVMNDNAYIGCALANNCLSTAGLATLSDRQGIRTDNNTACRHNLFLQDTTLPIGTFFETPLFTATLEPMGDDDYGQVVIDAMPFKITLNSRMALPRVRMSLAHEMLHILCEMHKINLPHEALHEVALLIVNEILPGMSALDELVSHVA